MEKKIFDIYANDRNEPTISLTYEIEKETKKLKDFKVWVRKGYEQDFEMINYGNLILFYVWIYNGNYGKRKVTEKDIWRFYQGLFAKKMWEQPKLSVEKVNTEFTLKLAPHRNFFELHDNYMKEFVDKQYKIYIKENMEKNGINSTCIH